jgi:hypothetical protein
MIQRGCEISFSYTKIMTKLQASTEGGMRGERERENTKKFYKNKIQGTEIDPLDSTIKVNQ